MGCNSQRHSPRRALAAVALTAASVVGCGGSDGRPDLAPVSGTVMLNESPLPVGQIIFQPISGGQPAVGRLSEDGSFTLGTYGDDDGAAVGRHRVRVTSYSTQAGESDAEASGDSLGELLVPERYANFSTSGIEVSVLATGNAPFVIKLEDLPQDDEDDGLAGDDSGDGPNGSFPAGPAPEDANEPSAQE